MAELAAAPPLETNTAQFDQPELTPLTPMQRFARPLYAAALGVRDRVDNAKQSLSDILGSNVDHAVEQAGIMATAAKEIPSHVGEKISNHRKGATAFLAIGTLVTGPAFALGARSKASQTPVTPLTPPKLKYHYMPLGGHEIQRFINRFQVKEHCKAGVTITSTNNHQHKKGIGDLKGYYHGEKGQHVVETLDLDPGEEICGSISSTLGKIMPGESTPRLEAFVPRFVQKGANKRHYVFVDPKPLNDPRSADNTTVYTKKVT